MEVAIDGIKFYGAPWIPTNKSGKAFSYLRNALGIAKLHWSNIPNEIHRVFSIDDYTAYEASTPELDDVVRIVDDNNRSS